MAARYHDGHFSAAKTKMAPACAEAKPSPCAGRKNWSDRLNYICRSRLALEVPAPVDWAVGAAVDQRERPGLRRSFVIGG